MRKRSWVGCWSSLFFFCKGGKGGGASSSKRIVPSSRLPDNSLNNNNNHHHNRVSLLPPPFDPSLLAPPSSPASFTNSALPSTAQSPSSFLSLSANSPGGPSSAMYATGPYAHEHQLVSPPVMSTFTTEPSTAPLTPPPELAHLTTPSSPDVPFAQFLSNHHHRHPYKTNYDSSGSGLISPVSRTPQLDGGDNNAQDSNFFCPATFAQFYLDQETNPSSFPHSGGRLSLSRESDAGVYSSSNNNNKANNKQQDVDEIEAYRASFGFSADEIITTPHYLEISDVHDDSSFTITAPFTSSTCYNDKDYQLAANNQVPSQASQEEEGVARGVCRDQMPATSNAMKGGDASHGENVMLLGSTRPRGDGVVSEEDVFKYSSKKYQHMGSSSDAEIDYRRLGSLKSKRSSKY